MRRRGGGMIDGGAAAVQSCRRVVQAHHACGPFNMFS